MTNPDRLIELAQDRRAALIAAWSIALIEVLAAIVESERLGVTHVLFVRCLHAALCVALALSLARVRRPSVTVAPVVFAATLIPFLAIFWLAHAERIRLGLTWWLPPGQKILVMFVAALAPGRARLGLILIGTFALESAIQTFWLGAGDLPGEPWTTIALAVVAAIVHHNRVGRLAAERAAITARAEADALARLARTVLAIRDLANTPLQTLDLSIEVLARRCPEAAPVVRRMERALARLRDLGKLLDDHDASAVWHPGDESIASVEVLSSSARRQ